MLSSPCPREGFCATKTEHPESCPLHAWERMGASPDYVANEETYVRMVFERTHLESDEALKGALSLHAIAPGASGNRLEKLTPAEYQEVINGQRAMPAGFFTVPVGGVREIPHEQADGGCFLFCPSFSGVHPDTHADLRFRHPYGGKKPPKSWHSYRDKLLRLCTRCLSLSDVFEKDENTVKAG